MAVLDQKNIFFNKCFFFKQITCNIILKVKKLYNSSSHTIEIWLQKIKRGEVMFTPSPTSLQGLKHTNILLKPFKSYNSKNTSKYHL